MTRYWNVVSLDSQGRVLSTVSTHMSRDEAVAACAELIVAHQTTYAVEPREFLTTNG